MNLNKKQRTAILIGVIVIVIMGLFPPWSIKAIIPSDSIAPSITKTLENRHSWINTPPKKSKKYFYYGYSFGISGEPSTFKKRQNEIMNFSYEINVKQLIIQWFLVCVLTGGIVIFLGKPKDKVENSGDKNE